MNKKTVNRQSRPRVAVVSPFLDKEHGTERYIAEQIERLAGKYEIYLYSSRVEGIDLSRITWRRVPSLRGPHLVAYCWWFVANHLWRWWDRWVRRVHCDLTYTPGINCFDADVVSVHILFTEFRQQVRNNLRLSRNPVPSWPRLIHRRIYYLLIVALEKLIYPRKRTILTSVSRRAAANLSRFGRSEVAVIPHGLRTDTFNPARRATLRDLSRKELGLSPSAFCLLLIGNGWKNKGLGTLIEAAGNLKSNDLRLLVVGQDDPLPYRAAIARLGLEEHVKFLPRRPDVEFYYAAADVYVGPSLEDSFGVPPLEAMACGVPVVVSRRAGVSELITDGVDGVVLNDYQDARGLAKVIAELRSQPQIRERLGQNGARTASEHTWERNAEQIDALFAQLLDRQQPSKAPGSSEAVARIAVISPFLDRRHGTERRASELVERFSRDYGYEVHVYSQSVRDIPRVEPFKSFHATNRYGPNGAGNANGNSRASQGRVFWHKLPRLPGPHLFNYVWWFASNHLWRWWDGRFRGGKFDLVYTPGINCLDADVASVHIIFSEFYRQVRNQLKLHANPVQAWPKIVHRRLYYLLIIALEKVIYSRCPPRLAAISRKTCDDIVDRWHREDAIPVVYGGLDPARFNSQRRVQLRRDARRAVGLADSNFALLMIGNDWKKKGLDCLLEAAGRLRNSALRVMVAGHDSIEPYRALIGRWGVREQLIFLPNRRDVEFYYAAADVYVCPSLEDAFAYPPFEAMACGLPVIVSSQAGVSELITDGVDALLLQDPRDAGALAKMIDDLYCHPEWVSCLGENAARTACQYTWERNAEQFKFLFEEVLQSKVENQSSIA